MHSRKSIFYRGIVFILSFLAMTLFSYSNVKAEECRVSFGDNNQYLIVSGDHSKWQDSGALIVTGDGCSNIKVNSITVNGEENDELGTKFSTASKSAGHYTVGYNYSYSQVGVNNDITGTIYRYVRVLNSNFETNNNYTLASFNETGSVIDSFDIGNNHFANFIVTSTDTYIVVKDVLGRDISSALVMAGTDNNFVAKRVIKGGDYFYIVGNDKESNGFLIVYNLVYNANTQTYTISEVNCKGNPNANYNSGYYYNNKMYVVGKSDDGYPLIDTYTTNGASIEATTTHSEKGGYLGVTVLNGTVYAVGYLKADNSNVSSDLFSYTTEGELKKVDVLKDPAGTISNTIFNDIIIYGDSLVIVGETTLVDINANGNYAANHDSRYSDALILKVSTDGTVLRNVSMVGTAHNDTFTQIKEYDVGKYVAIGTQNEGNASLVYTLDTEFNVIPHLTSGNSSYKVNGIVTWSYGEVYYGKITPTTTIILGMYYPKTNSTSDTPLFVSLDTRTFANYSSLNLIKENKYVVCASDYDVTYGGGTYPSLSCDTTLKETDDGYYIDTSVLGNTQRLNYSISTQTGATILIYRVINVSEEPLPVDLNNYKTGILRWYVYNRPYTYTNENLTRLESSSFNYSSSLSIEEIIEEYVSNGSSSATLRGVSNNPQTGEIYNTFTKHTQNSAAFASIEYAKKFAYYLEFSRVVRVEGKGVDDIGAIRYSSPTSGSSIRDGASFYIYYIDYRGTSGTSNLVNECAITPTSVSNCSNKGGYAFANLNDLRIVIEHFLTYNNFFVTTRNTIYNGSIMESTLDAYYQNMYTTEYLKNLKIDSLENSLTINVEKNGNLIYSGVDKHVYFGGTLSGSTYVYSNLTLEVSKEENAVYYTDTTEKYIIFPDDGCYKVYYTYVNASGHVSSPGAAREFCIDTTAPTIIYDKDSSAIDSAQSANANTGTNSEKPLFIESSFSIVGLDDLDPYSFIEVNGSRYPITCSDNSESCDKDIKQYILQRFEYNKNNTRQVLSITFYDRLLNKNTFYFVVGTNSPTIDIVNQTEDGFTLVVDFYEANPIVTSSLLVVSQTCSGESSSKCYDPNVIDKDKPITDEANLLEFNKALLNYILAVSYRDNELAKKEVLTVSAIDDVYTIGTISYIVEDGYFVELSGYGDPIAIGSDNLFNYGKDKYLYDETTSSIYTMKVDDDGDYVIDDSIESITLFNDNTFKFDIKGREYQVVTIGGNSIINPIPLKYEIVNNEFEIDDVVYKIDLVNKFITYSNPDIGRLKHIELAFKRTTVTQENNVDVIVEGGGVNIPLTEPVMENGVHKIDSVTNQYAYNILPEQYIHFDLVDGSYTFTITENFPPYSHQARTDINVADLEIDIGVAKNILEGNEPLDITEKTQYSFDLDSDDATSIALRTLDGNDNYPLDPTIIKDSNISAYKNTYFVDRTFYVGVTFGSMSVLIIKIYDELNSYGIPSNSTACRALVIYGDSYTSIPLETDDVGCGNSGVQFMKFSAIDASKLTDYGATRINSGFFGFNSEFTFYEITFTAYESRSGEYVEVVNPLVNYVYIDTVGPDDEDIKEDGAVVTYKDTIIPEIYNSQGQLSGYEFLKDEEGKNVLNQVVGTDSHVTFNIKFNTGNSNDVRENKLLLLSINDGTDAPPMCNIYELIDNGANYDTGCKLYVNLEDSKETEDGVRLVFSTTGAYEITIRDASNNYVVYSFIIDKNAPSVSVVNATDNIYNGRQLVEQELRVDSKNNGSIYYLAGYYTKNPSVTVRLEDLIGASQYCYKFYSSSISETDAYVYECLAANNENEEYVIKMPTNLIDILSANSFNGDITLYVYGIDAKGNGTSSDAISIHFWVDYQAASVPENGIVKKDLNDSEIAGAQDLNLNTIGVFSSDYSQEQLYGVECVYVEEQDKYLFSFIDTRDGIAYTFSVECQDIHGNESSVDIYSKGFSNTIYMKFYESDDGVNRNIDGDDYELFNFSMTNETFYTRKNEEDKINYARWIYITIVDSVGNESEKVIVLPIFVQDKIAPSVEKAGKENPELAGDYIDISSVKYNHSAIEISGYTYKEPIYIANTSIKITFSEPIFKVVSCSFVTSSDEYTTSNDCENYADKVYKYSMNQINFIFENETPETTKIYVIVVEDFATLNSVPVVVIIDRTTPEIGYYENGDKDDLIEYKYGAYAYDESYINSGYGAHVYVDDDQEIDKIVYVSYQLYSPRYTYNNYVQQNGVYTAIDNYQYRQNGQKYYLLINKDIAMQNNKECIGNPVIKSNVTYCYVEDINSYYYFDSLLDDETGRFWQDVAKIDNTTLGVYRVTYYVKDYAGNISGKIYKKVLVSDTNAPDVNIYDGETLEYANVTSTNNNEFQGKLNKTVVFEGIDKINEYDEGVRLVLYKCESSKYKAESENEKCYIENQTLYSTTTTNPSRVSSTSNKWNLGSKLGDGVYKLFAYDPGGYSNTTFNYTTVYYDYNGDGNSIGSKETIYSRDYNTSYFYFAINIGETGASYVINGNKYTSDYPSNSTTKKKISYAYSDLNFYTITHKSDVDHDVYLVVENEDGSYTDISGSNASWVKGFSKSKNQNTIIYTYTDSQGRTVYEVTYEPYSVAEGLYLHETYHNVNYENGTVEVCRIVNGENPCTKLETVYKVTSVVANIYEDGVYTLRMKDRYGNLSPEVAPFMVDNSAYYVNKNANPATGVNYWFSVPSQPISDSNVGYFRELNKLENYSNINVLDSKFNGNFNSDYFYAFASKVQARTYLINSYIKEINRVFALSAGNTDVYSLKNTQGVEIASYRESEWINGENIVTSSEFIAFVSSIIYSTYIGDSSFDDEGINQVAYAGSEAISSMYEYAMLKVTKTTDAGVVSRTYNLITNGTCSEANENEECVKVALRIVNEGTEISLNISNDTNVIMCRTANAGGSGSNNGTGCNVSSTMSGAIYVFIDSDDVAGAITRYHVNEVYFGVISYSEAAEVQYSQLGEYVPLIKFERYAQDGDDVSDANGRYIWLNSKYVLIDEIIKTNLYASTCTFNEESFSDCVYVTYLSGYNKSFDADEMKYVYTPAQQGAPSHYLNYYDGNYYTKDEIVEILDQKLTFSANGEISNGGSFVPIKTTIQDPITTDLQQSNSGVYTNKKVYLELFNESSNSKLFEVKRVSDDEIYSYASLKINGNPININDKIIVGSDGTYRCIIDIPLESSYAIEVMDRAGNKFTIVISHSDTIPNLDFALDDDTLTTSGATVKIETSSSTASFTKNNVSIYKYNTDNDSYVTYEDALCIAYRQESLEVYTPVRQLDLVLKNIVGRNCSGAYKIAIEDNHGNKNYIEFVFNPYDLTTEYIVDTDSNVVHNYNENGIDGTIISSGFKVEINAEINYMVINKYDAYTNLDLTQSASSSTIEIRNFGIEQSIGNNCSVIIVAPNSGNIYSIYIRGDNENHSCDGVYTIDIYNRFADEVLNDVNLTNLEGANSEQITYRVKYGESSSIEIDTTLPPIDKLEGDDQYFALYIDDVISNEDTISLIDDKSISYTNKYVTVSWGKLKGQSFTYLKYRVNPEDENTEWTTVSENVTYAHGYDASYKFMITSEGVYNCEFMFVDAVGNEDVSQKFTIVITIEPPKVEFYEIISGDANNTVIIGDKYDYGERIASQTILKCLDEVESGTVARDCTWDDYNYNMVVNGTYFEKYAYSTSSDNTYKYEANLNLKEIINRDSYWLRGSLVRESLELFITLTVSVKGKDDIKTVLYVIIDQRAPEITFAGKVIGSTYTGNVLVNLSKEDSSNYAEIYRCDVIEGERCLVYNNKVLVEEEDKFIDILPGTSTATISSDYSGYFMVVAKDNLGNTSRNWLAVDNEAPEIVVETANSVIAPNMYTNAKSVFVTVSDKLSEFNSTFTIEFTPLDENESKEITYNPLVGLTKEGKYTLTPIDGVNIEGRSITFYIYRNKPIYLIFSNVESTSQTLSDLLALFAEVMNGGDGLNGEHLVAEKAQISWPKYGSGDSELYAPIVSVSVDGRGYKATYIENADGQLYLGDLIDTIGNHTIVVTDAAGNIATTMLTINNTNNVCINGKRIEVKMQAYYNVNELLIGKEADVDYQKDDVIIFALPSQVSSGECMENGLLGYRTLDPEHSNFLISDDRTANLFRTNKYDFVANQFISPEAIAEVNNVGGTVIVFVVTKDIANGELGYSVGTNFFLEDPIGWSMIFVVCLSMIWPTVRIFVKKKVKVI